MSDTVWRFPHHGLPENQQDIEAVKALARDVGAVEIEIDYETAGLAYWNEEGIGSTEPNKPPFDNFEDYKGIWIERARSVLNAALGIGGDEPVELTPDERETLDRTLDRMEGIGGDDT